MTDYAYGNQRAEKISKKMKLPMKRNINVTALEYGNVAIDISQLQALF
ncbi:hypothetical protein [Janthinobacterium sp. LB3P112]